MENKRNDGRLDELIRASMQVADEAPQELNDRLKAALYERQNAEGTQRRRAVSLWYLPMLANAALFSILAVFAVMAIPNLYLARFAAGACVYAGFAGIMITLVAVRRTDIKQELSVSIK